MDPGLRPGKRCLRVSLADTQPRSAQRCRAVDAYCLQRLLAAIAARFLLGRGWMRTLLAALIGVVLLSAAMFDPPRTRIPTVDAETVRLSEVRRASEFGMATGLGDSSETLLVERPVDAPEGAPSSVFVVDQDGLLLRRVPVVYGRGSSSWIHIVSGVSAGDRIVVSGMRAWDSFDRLRLR
jgi:hypothetical protein